jgi:hypothetical protein
VDVSGWAATVLVPLEWYVRSIVAEADQLIAMLRILLAICETALDAFRAACNPIDAEFVADLERITERTRGELAALTKLRKATDPA